MESPVLPDMVVRARRQQVQVVIFQKVRGASVLEQAHRLAAAGIKTIYAVCDLVDAEMARATDCTIVVTEYLKSHYPQGLRSKIHVVHDGIEHPEVVKTERKQHCGSPAHPLHAVLVTSLELDRLPVLKRAPDWLRITIVGRYPPEAHRWQRFRRMRWALAQRPNLYERLAFLRFLADRGIRRVAWDPVGVYKMLLSADLAIIPVDHARQVGDDLPPQGWQLKSENRLTLKMSIGLPVIATPIPSYQPVIEQGTNGFLAACRTDWLEYLERLRDPAVRTAVGERARASVIGRYSKEEQARRLISVIVKLCHG
jgi:hypothetical protein